MNDRALKDEGITDVDICDNNNMPALHGEVINAELFERNLIAQKTILDALKKYVRNELVAGIDYYSVKKGALPSLGQPGAEKINFLFHLIPKPILEEKVYNGKEIRYEYIVELYNKNTGNFAGSGVGCCSSQEDKYKYYWDKNGNRHEIDNHINIANTIKKMAYKRGYVDACVKNTMASFLFTQDLEELPDYYIGKDSDPNVGKKPPKPTTTDATPPVQSDYGLDPETYKLSGGKHVGKRLIDCDTNYIQWQIDTAKTSKYKQTFEKVPMDIWIEFLEVCLKIHIANKELKNNPITDKDLELNNNIKPEVYIEGLEPEFADIEEATPEEYETLLKEQFPGIKETAKSIANRTIKKAVGK